MESISVGELKARFSEVLERIRDGEEIIVSYGKKHKKVAVLLPYERYSPGRIRKLGVLKRRARCVIHKDFKVTDEEILQS